MTAEECNQFIPWVAAAWFFAGIMVHFAWRECFKKLLRDWLNKDKTI